VSLTRCHECGAEYDRDDDSCTTRFDALLALDHSRRPPWGPRHLQAFGTFALQHPSRHPASLDSVWAMLYRIYRLGQPSDWVVSETRRAMTRPATIPAEAARGGLAIPARASEPLSLPTMTIADLGDFDAETYPALLDDWCRATLAMWGA
jgi:hypothetical protein